ncbi:MAG: CdaR family protein [Eubacteriales bacterium]|nr:CdaR family protein [Eubacteriales bacterium]
MKDTKLYKWFVRNNIGYKLVALFLAIMLWYYVAGQRNPIVERIYTVPVTVQSISSDRLLVSPLPEVRVTAKGMRSIMNGLSKDDFRAYVAVPEQEAGERIFPVQVDVPSGVQVVTISPERVTIDLDVLTEKQVPVRVLVRGETAPGFTYKDPSVTPEQVTLKGPGRLLDEITDVQAVVEVNGAQSDISRQVKVQLTTNNDQVTVTPDTVQVQLPVATSGPVKTVALTVAVEGEVAEGFEVKSQSVEPNNLRVTGPQQVMASLQEIRTRPVSLSGAQGTISREVDLALPDGVVSLGRTRVRVTIVIEPVEPAEPPEEEQLPGPDGEEEQLSGQ